MTGYGPQKETKPLALTVKGNIRNGSVCLRIRANR